MRTARHFAMLVRSSARLGGWGFVLSLAALLPVGRGAIAAEPSSETLDFLHTLRDRGYAGFAADYLKAHENDPQLPKDVRDIWGLEMANCLWAGAAQSYNAGEAQQLRTAAETYLAKFLKEQPHHPAIADAMVTWGTASLERGLGLLNSAKAMEQTAERDKTLVSAREAFDEARPRFAKAVEAYQAQLKALAENAAVGIAPEEHHRKSAHGGHAPSPADAALQDVRFRSAQARCKAALVEYWSAQTVSDPKSPQRIETLRMAGKSFDAIYQDFRGTFPGLFAHYWNAKIVGETGDPATALDICDEILAIFPDSKGLSKTEVDSEDFSLLVDAFILQLQMQVQSGDAKKAREAAADWMRKYTNIRTSAAYQGVALELAKMQMAQLDKAPDDQSQRLRRSVLDLLTKIIQVRSNFQQEAIALRRQLSGGQIKGEGKTFEEALALADTAAQSQEWDQALAMYAKALDLLPKSALSEVQRKEQRKQVRERLARVHYRQAVGLYSENKFAEAADAGEKIAQDFPDTQIGASAIAIAMFSVQRLSADPKLTDVDRGPIIDRLVRIAQTAIKNWPDRPEADDARLALGQISVFRGDPEQAIKIFATINPNSPRFPTALLSAAKQSWRMYLIERAKPEAQRDAKKLETARRNARNWLAKSLDLQRNGLGQAPAPGAAGADSQKPLRDQFAETQLLLAEVCLENKEFQKAIEIYQPLIDAILKDKPKSLDLIALRTFSGAVKAYVEQGDLVKAGDVGVALAELGGDTPQVNGILIGLCKYLVKDFQQANAKLIEVSSGTDIDALHKAQAQFNDAKDHLSQILSQLAPRQQISLGALIYVGDNCIRIGMKTEGRALYERILAQAQKDKDFAKSNGQAIIRTRAQLVGLLREEGKFAEAIQEIDKLLEINPRALDLLMQKGRIYQSWAKAEPQHYGDAVAQWTLLRTMMTGMPNKPPEYYEVIYNAAECLVFESQQSKKPTSANQAEQLLRATLALSPKLSGPEMVARYKVLIASAVSLQGHKPAQ